MSTIKTTGANNAFIKLQESANGRVSVKMQKNQFSKEGAESFYGKVERYTYSTQNILDAMSESLPLVDAGTVASVLNAYANTLIKILASGNAAKFGELGTFYIAGKGAVGSGSDKPALTVKFSASRTLKEAAQNIEIASSEYAEPSGVIASVVDVSTGKTDGTLTANGSVLVEGSNLKVGGDSSGVWIAPCAENGKASTDESTWIKIQSALIFNQPSKLLFALPENISGGKYRIVVRTRYAGRAGYERKYLIEAISDTVEIA